MRYSELQVSSDLLDQPKFTGEPKKIFILSTPRSGSYMLCRFMINAGVGVPHEYFNPIVMQQMAPRLGLGEVSVAKKRPRLAKLLRRGIFGRDGDPRELEFLEKYIGVLMERRCQGGVFAAKIHFDQYIKVLANPVGRKLLDGGQFIYLFRENLLSQSVSVHFSNMTGRWSIDDSITTEPVRRPNFFDSDAIDRAIVLLSEQDRGWRIFLARNGIVAMSISYERLCADPVGFIDAVAERIGMREGEIRRGYSESGAVPDKHADVPDKRSVIERYLEDNLRIRPLEMTPTKMYRTKLCRAKKG